MANLSAPEWYAFTTRFKHEKKVNQSIQQAGFESYLPLHKTLSTRKDRKKWIETPLFPSYIFTKIPYNKRLNVLQIPSILDIVGFNNVPSPVRPDEIDAIKSLLDSDSQYEVIAGLTVGSRVRITSGPLDGMTAHVSQLRGKERVVVNISALGKSIILCSSDHQIEKLNDDN